MELEIKQTPFAAVRRVLPWLWLAAGYALDLWYLLVPGRWIVDGDLASEMVLANQLNQTGEIIASGWYYSNELRVLNMQWFYRVGLLLFPSDWHLARAFGMAAALALYAAVLLFFAHCAGLGRAGQWIVGALLWPFGKSWLVYGLYGGYYLIHTVFYTASLALVLRAQTARRRLVPLLGACALALLGGLNGVKTLMVFHAPFFCAALVVLILALHECGHTDVRAALSACRAEVYLWGASVLTMLFAGVGYLIYSKVLPLLYEFKSYGFIQWQRRDSWFGMDDVLLDFFHEFGYRDNAGVFHFSGIASALGLLIGVFMVLCLVRLLRRIRTLETVDRLLVLVLVFMLAICTVCFTYFGEYAAYFWLMTFPAAFAVMAVELKTERFHIRGARSLAAAALVLALTVCSVNNVRQEIEHPTLGHAGLNTAASWLVENGYTQGYATFWNCNNMIEMTSGKLDVWTLDDLDSDSLPDWLQVKTHLTTDPEHPFVLIDTETDGTPEEQGLIRCGDCEKVYDDGRYVIYAFESADAVHAAAAAAEAE